MPDQRTTKTPIGWSVAVAHTQGIALDIAERLALLADLLVTNPASAVGLCDPGGNIGDAGHILGKLGIRLDGHGVLTGSALIEFIAIADAGSISDAARDASVRGCARVAVRLRDGQRADLHLFEVSDTEKRTVAIIVPTAGESIAGTAKPTAIEATSRIGVVLADGFGLITSASASTLVLIGGNEPIVGTSVVHLIYPDDQEMAVVNWLAAKAHRGVALKWRCRLAKVDGSSLWTETTITNDVDSDGTGVVRLELYDISTEVAATEALVAERELIGLLTETLPVGVAKFDAGGRVEHANGRLTELLAPLDPREMLSQAVRGQLENVELAAAFRALMRDGVASRLVVDHVDANGAVQHLEWTIRAALGGGGEITGGVVCIADVSEAIRLRAALEGRATTDALTGCLNRAGTVTALELALSNVDRTGGVGVLFIDLDDFKSINDTHGHAVGDAVLEVVASRLRSASRSGDLVGRLGGDEFVVISTGLQSAESALAYACRVSEHIQGPATVAGLTVPIGASIGVAWTMTGTAPDLLGAADGAMYISKQTDPKTPVLSATPPLAAA
jgi:diguanylate cyclase (GGDEF)-like protein